MRKILLAAVGLVALAHGADAQGVFQNLDFEQASPFLSPGQAPTSEALPGWTAYYGTTEQSQVSDVFISTGAPQVTLLSSADKTLPPIDGQYSVLLQPNPLEEVSIGQTGLIPAGTSILTFLAQGSYSGSLQLTVGGAVVPFAAMDSGADYTVYAADVSAWAGDTEQIVFTAESQPSHRNWKKSAGLML